MSTKYDEIISSLSEAQRELVLAEHKTLRIFAGPGSGKTQVLTTRIAHFILKRHVAAEQILALAFNKKAAQEIHSRLVQLVGEETAKNINIFTYHAFFLRMLREYTASRGQPQYKIINEKDCLRVITKIKADLNLPLDLSFRNEVTKDTVFRYISNAKCRGENHIKFANIYSNSTKKLWRQMAVAYSAYEEVLEQNRWIDFGSILIKAKEILSEDPAFGDSIQCIFVDELQDTNTVQFELLEMLSKNKDKMLTFVGDPDQSIFAWRCAEPKHFINMEKRFPGMVTVNLGQNYRSSGSILESARHLIEQDSSRDDRTLFTENPQGIPFCWIEVPDEEAQAEFVAKEIKRIKLFSKKLIDYNDIAVLCRANYSTQAFEQAFRRHKIPFELVGGELFFVRAEVQDIIAYLKFCYNPFDFTSLKKIINVPPRRVTSVILDRLESIAREHQVNFLGAIEFLLNERLNLETVYKLTEFVKICKEVRFKMECYDAVSDIIMYLTKEIGYEDYLKKDRKQTERWFNVGELVTVAKQQEYEDATSKADNIEELDELKEIFKDPPVVDFIKYCDACYNQNDDTVGKRVTIATLHSSKGLEWPCVFIASCINGLIPASGSKNHAEERRLLYVGFTRSKFFLYCMIPRIKQVFGSIQRAYPSDFLQRIKPSCFTMTTPQWNDEVRRTLAQILRRPTPEPDSFLVTDGKNFDGLTSSSQPTTSAVDNQHSLEFATQMPSTTFECVGNCYSGSMFEILAMMFPECDDSMDFI